MKNDQPSTLSNGLRIASIAFFVIVGGWFTIPFLPWWRVLVFGLVGGLVFGGSLKKWSFCAGFIGGAILWGAHALYLSDLNGDLLANRIGGMFGNIGAAGTLALTAFLGGLYGGLGAWTGKLLRRLA